MYRTGKIIRQALVSPTVMVLDLDVPGLWFEPGQWIDFMVPPHEWVGGFSIASSPRQLPLIRIAVKKSSHLPAAWVHSADESSHVEETVEICVGGTCILREEDVGTRPLVFCAGGIGISPILSQYREFLFYRDYSSEKVPNDKTKHDDKPKSMFLYSVATPEELVFGKELVELSRPGSILGHDRMEFTFTKTTTTSWNEDPSSVHVDKSCGRKLIPFLDEAPKDSLYFICGPPSMIDDAVSHLKSKGVPCDSVKYEKWW
jgi:ferredoxin-NADP reductase